jgi:hypothetical protein
MGEERYTVDVDGVGTFIFSKRKQRAQFRIKAELVRLTEGVTLSEDDHLFAVAMATLKVLTLEAPKGWTPSDLDNLDPFDEDVQRKLLNVFLALRAREESFRGKPKAGSQAAGAGEGE